MHFIQDDEIVFMVREILVGIGETRAIRDGLEVEINRRASPPDLLDGRRLSHLTLTQERHRRAMVQEVKQSCLETRKSAARPITCRVWAA